MEKVKRHLALFLAFLLIFSSVPINGHAQEGNQQTQTQTKEIKANAEAPPATVDLPKGEVVKERDAYSKVFYNGDGTFTKKIYSQPIHKKSKGKDEWEEISSSLVDSSDATKVITENALLNAAFNKHMKNGQYANFNFEDHLVTYSLLEASGEVNKVSVKDGPANYKVKSHEVLYKDVFPDIDLRNITFDQNNKEDLVLKSYKGFNTLKFHLATDLEAKIQQDGSIDFNINGTDKKVFNLPKPFMADSKYDDHSGEVARSENVTFDLQKEDDGYDLTIKADPNWLKDPSRVYPVYIDPSTSITTSTDTFVMSAYPSENYSTSTDKWDSGQSQYVLKTGYYDGTTGTCYGFLNQSLSSLNNMTVTNADFHAYVTHSYYSTTANGLWIDSVNTSWSAGTMTWNNKPASTNITSVNVMRDQWANFDVTSTVKAWVDGTKANYGFKLHTNGNGQTYWKKVVSTTNSSLKPYLSVDYTIPVPQNLKGTVYSNGNGTGYANLTWDKVDGATGYKVWIYNGTAYESYSVGNVTSWSTNGQKIWPTAAEISSGKYDLHQDKLGAELAVDPSPVYKNSGGGYPTSKNYWFRVSAIFSQGESSTSGAFMPTIPNLAQPAVPTGTSYSNGNGTGYIDFSWKPISGATGYKVWIFNGSYYEAKDVGNVTSWTTKGKKYWPTPAETTAGRYQLHLSDGAGAELAADPSDVYSNAGTRYATTTNYYIRVSAYNSQGETIYSNPLMPYIPDVAVPSAPKGVAYSNKLGSSSGYVMLNWDKIPNATGYKVWIFNGREYESWDVGDVDTWTTQNKGIWPTADEITNGTLSNQEALHLHKDGKGQELPMEPSGLYSKMGTAYATSKLYYFRLSAYNAKGETIYSNSYYSTVIPEATEYLGKEDYWSFVDVPYGSVNASTGNLIIDENDLSISGRGPDFGLGRTYNSLSKSIGLFGKGWHSDAEMSVTISGDKANFIDEDATLHTFTKQSDGTYLAPTGVYLELQETTTDLIITSKDQTKYYFAKSGGKLTKIIDGYGNTTTYNYTNGLLTSITDASQRTISINYNSNGKIEKIIDPGNRTFSYQYQNDLLVKAIDPEMGETIYEYDNLNNLIKVYEPTHTTEKPVINQFKYTDGRITEAINPNNKSYLLAYDGTNQTLTLTQPNGNRDQYTFNAAANPVKVVEDLDGLQLTSTYLYEGNNVKELKDPNDQSSTTPTESYTYDDQGNVLTAKDSYGTETYQYNDNNDVTSTTDTEGDQTTIAYDGLNAVSMTDQSGKVSSVAKYNLYGNILESSDTLAAATNLLANSSFEDGTTLWSLVNSNDLGTLTTDTVSAAGLNGIKALKLNSASSSPSTELGYTAAIQEVSVLPNTTYTLSGKIKSNLSKAHAFFNVLFLDGQNNKWADNRYSQLAGTRPWTERQLTFTTPANTTKIRVYLEVDHKDSQASGTAWFDGIQLEQTQVSSSFNPVNNSSFEDSLNKWTGTGGAIDNSTSFDGSQSLKIVRTGTAQAASVYKQTINIGQDASAKPINLTLTGLTKALDVKPNGTVSKSDYSITAKVWYTDNTTQDYSTDLPIGKQEWNRGAVLLPAVKPVSRIDVMAIFQGNYTGTVWFDAIRLMEGSIVTHNTYDAKGNYVTKVEDELGYSISKKYDEVGNLLEDTDAKGSSKIYNYNLRNLLDTLQLANGTSIGYSYNKNGDMNSKTITASSGDSQKFTYVYDESGKLLKTIGPLNEVSSNEYDGNGNKVKTVLPNGNIIQSVYDGTDRVKDLLYNGEKFYSFTYDKNGDELSVNYEKEARTKSRKYDTSNRLTVLTDRGGNQQWEYPSQTDKLKSFTFTQGSFSQKNTFSYNELDQNTLVDDGSSTYRFDYDEKGNVKTFTTGNGAGSNFNYDDRGMIENLVVGTADGNEILNEKYHYDKNGNRTSIDYIDGTSTAYEFGELDELTKETLRDGTVSEFHYDGFGNRDEVKVTKNGTTTSTVSKYNQENQLTQFGDESITYDLNGNRLTDSRYKYAWNAADQLISVTKQGESTPFVTYAYDEDGRRIQKNLNGTTTNYFYDGDSLNVLYETDAQNNVLRSYIYSQSGQLLAMQKGAQKYFYHYNVHGDVIALTDSNGAIAAKYEYDAWGNPLKAEEGDQVKDNPFRYASYQYDSETGLYYLMARYYQPNQGVFLSIDPNPGDSDDILTQNGYTYANDNPVRFTDPDGNWALDVAFMGYDLYQFKKKPSWKNALWVGASAMSFIDPTGLASTAIHIGRLGKATHTVYTLTRGEKIVYVGRTMNAAKRKAAHKLVHSDATYNEVKSGLTYAEARGLEHRLYLKNGGKAKLRNKIRPISKRNKKYNHYMKASRNVYRSLF